MERKKIVMHKLIRSIEQSLGDLGHGTISNCVLKLERCEFAFYDRQKNGSAICN